MRRRAVVVALVALSLVMITGYFRESEDGIFHDIQGGVAQALEPVEIAADRLSRPFRDVWGWFDGLREAKSERDRLQAQNAALLAELARAETEPPGARIGGIEREARAPRFATDFELLRSEVLAESARYAREVTVSAGSNDGVEVYDPVVSTRSGFLVGHVSKVGPSTALVTLLTDTESAVAAYDRSSDAKGVVRGRGPGESMVALDRVAKQEVVTQGDYVFTSGRLSGASLESFYPRGILIGRVETVDQSDTSQHKLVLVRPFADLGSLDDVVVLLRKKPLPQVP
jgi:rod shape-determining protein MreC